jgi:NAD(P)H-hydrate epimerase
MKVISAEQMRGLEGRAIAECGISGESLMERAGRGVADSVSELARISGVARPKVLLAAGKGNNGGDAFVAARILVEQGIEVEVWLAGTSDQISGDAKTQMDKMSESGVRMRQMPLESDWDGISAIDMHWDIVVDGLIGTGLKGAVKGLTASAIAFVNRASRRSLVMAIDLPSGLNADIQETVGEAVHADLTVTMGLPKHGLLTASGIECVGSLKVVDLGISPAFLQHLECPLELIVAEEVGALFRRRPRNAHKGSFGHVLIIGGSAGRSGAIVMAAQAALRSGVGLVSVVTPRSVWSNVAASMKEAMVFAGEETTSGVLTPDFWPDGVKDLKAFDAVLVGPGMGTQDECRLVVMDIIRRCKVPLVLDADALNVHKRRDRLIPTATCAVIMTPHPGELARFMAEDVAGIQSDRLGACRRAVEATKATVVLKGAGTLVAASGEKPAVNMTGNPGMAKGGSGDILAGIIVGLLGQGLAPFAASRAGVYIQGRAGDRAALRLSQAGMLASDIIDDIPFVMRELCGR